MQVLIPLPDRDFDVTEVAVPWRLLTDAGHEAVFATEHGGVAPAADQRLLDGVIFGRLGAYDEPKAFYRELLQATAFQRPVAWASLNPADYDGLLLAGGHAPGMRQYLSSTVLQDKVAEFWTLGRPVGAICHGVLSLPAPGRRAAAAASSRIAGRPACPSTWNAAPTTSPPGAWAVTTGHTPRTSRTRSPLPWLSRASSCADH